MATISNTATAVSSGGTSSLSNSIGTISLQPNTNTYISTGPSTSYGTLSINSIYSYGSLEYTIRQLFADEEISETTIRSIIIDMNKSGKSEQIDYNNLLTCRTLSEKFLNDFYDKFDKGALYRTQQLSLEFIKKHLDDIKENPDACRELSYHQRLDEEFIDMFADHINWAGLATNTQIKFTVSFLLKYIENFDDLALKSLCQNDAISTGVFNALLQSMPEDIRYRLDWESVSWHKELTEENIVNNIDFIDFNSLLLCTRKFKDDVITCFRKVKFGI